MSGTTTTSQPPVTTVTTRVQASEFQGDQNDSVLLALPTDAVLTILSHMGPNTLTTFSLSCRYVNALSRDEFLWEHLFHEHFPFEDSVIPSNVSALETYKKAHIDQRIHQNLTNNVYAFHVLEGHTDSVVSLLIKGNRLFSGSWDNTIKVWDLESKECVTSVSVDEHMVLSFAMKEDTLYAGTRDGKILIPDLEAKEYLTLEGLKSPIFNLAIGVDKLYMQSYGSDITILNLLKTDDRGVIQLTEKPFHNFATEGNKLYISCYEDVISIYDLRTEGEVFCEELKGRGVLAAIRAIEGNKLYSSLNRTDRTLISVSDLKINNSSVMTIPPRERGHPTTSAIGGGKVAFGYVKNGGGIDILDYGATDKVIFKELAGLFVSENPKDVAAAMDRFSRMPDVAKRRVYTELYLILFSSDEEYSGSGEDAFLDRNEQSATPAQKAQAIENYLKSFPLYNQ